MNLILPYEMYKNKNSLRSNFLTNRRGRREKTNKKKNILIPISSRHTGRLCFTCRRIFIYKTTASASRYPNEVRGSGSVLCYLLSTAKRLPTCLNTHYNSPCCSAGRTFFPSFTGIRIDICRVSSTSLS